MDVTIKLPTAEQLDATIKDLVDEGCAFPYLMAHCPRALVLLDKLIEEGQKTHSPMDWKALGMDGNRERAVVHLKNMMDRFKLDTKTDDYLNAVCRQLFGLELREEVKELVADATNSSKKN